MKSNEFKKLVSKDFVEIDEDEYFHRYHTHNCVGDLNYETSDGKILFFKPKAKFPIITSTKTKTFSVYEQGQISIYDKKKKVCIGFRDSLDKLYETVELSNKLRGKNGLYMQEEK